MMAAPKRLKIDSGRKRLRLSMSHRGIAEAKGKVAGMQRKLGNLMPVLKVGARDIDSLMKQNFELEEDPGGKKWGALKPSTKQSRIARGKEAKQRTKSGQLTEKAKRKRAERAAPGGIKILSVSHDLQNTMFAKAFPKGIMFGGEKKYLAFHQQGTKDMVSRKVAPVEKLGRGWKLIKRGRAQAVFFNLDVALRRHVSSA